MPATDGSGNPIEKYAYPFGYLDGDYNVTKLPRKMQEIGSPSETWAIMDADRMSVNFGPWRTNLPSGPVHGAVWDRLYFDGHAASVKRLD